MNMRVINNKDVIGKIENTVEDVEKRGLGELRREKEG